MYLLYFESFLLISCRAGSNKIILNFGIFNNVFYKKKLNEHKVSPHSTAHTRHIYVSMSISISLDPISLSISFDLSPSLSFDLSPYLSIYLSLSLHLSLDLYFDLDLD